MHSSFMSRLLVISLLLSLTLSFTKGVAAADLTTMVPKSIESVGRLDWQALRNTDLISSYIDNNQKRYQAMTSRLTEQAGMELEQIDEVWVFAAAEGDGAVGVIGTFDLQTIAGKIEEDPNSQRVDLPDTELAFSFHDQRKQNERLGVFIDSSTMLAGQPELIKAFLAAGSEQGNTYSADHPKLQKLKTDSAMLAATVFSIPPEWQQSKKMPIVQMVMPMVQDMYMTADLGDALDMRLALTPQSDVQDQQLEKVLSSILQLGMAQQQQAAKQQPANPSTQMVISLLKQVNVKQQGEEVLVSLSLGSEFFAPFTGQQRGAGSPVPLAE